MRSRLAAPVVGCLVAALALPAAALPRLPLAADPGVVSVQNRFIPRIFGEGEKDESQAQTQMRLQELESQVRMLTGQVEQLTFTVRRLEQAIAAGGTPNLGDRSQATPGPGEPPRSLGSLPTTPGQSTASNGGGAVVDLGRGPVDLSALNQGNPAVSTASAPPRPVSTDALQQVRDLQQSGRYQMAAQEARKVLTDNPSGPVAGEARFLLGEAMLAQGDYRNAANLFLENYTSDPNGARAPASLLRLGTALNGLGEKEAACSSLAEFFGAYPNVDGQLRAEAERERRAANCA
ncbi:tetratricopeptide repeat protein [Acuticoccus kandeliae]|uniref:tetratricopeptide repeat protein n=1 Tax=Acuticoccus kandeliae TaxID=2073160 RepID=UPI001300750A|nr:tetratricopeptide repeat protein [Acuticoccus kandeliae]